MQRRLSNAVHYSIEALAICFGLFAFAARAHAASAASGAIVDLELVIAADVSVSMDVHERRLQQQGFVEAFRDPEVIGAITGGPHGRIAVTFVEWGGVDRQVVVTPWRVIEDKASAYAFAGDLERRVPGRLARGTAIGDALIRSASLFEGNGIHGARQAIDLSGDGVSNNGRPLELARQSVLAKGITINGLPIAYRDVGLNLTAAEEELPPEMLVRYFQDDVIGGPGAFVQPVLHIDDFSDAIRSKLIREIRGRTEISMLGDLEHWPYVIGQDLSTMR
ncbi:DUF1194 domain-containing protein [Kaistia dalseonensis]|uniref:DUF1194 domain-containing protein n=1 Tax=Kaistia dalseonensis TaxID=410840 RepID=A0ABU0H240_9HYPH|nr:DUF1194 domain-containing protein [Kaistia dalseonensis]MCX5493801.1 DUF1194 domain-containing protein [Kaistia dalseonensis]MDQ0436366.1 hypothetical protein [Kaistia dalseonensis]